jgi:hypothetical protein
LPSSIITANGSNSAKFKFNSEHYNLLMMSLIKSKNSEYKIVM